MSKWKEYEFNEVFDVRDGTHDSPKYQDKGYPLVTSKNLINGSIDLTKIKYISEEDYNAINKRSKVDVGDVLFAMIGTIGNPVQITEEPNFAIKNVALFKQREEVQDSRYLSYFLGAPSTLEKMLKDAKGATQKFVGLGYLRKFKIPLPPLPVQKQIVAKLDALFKRIDKSIALLEENIKYTQDLMASVLDEEFGSKSNYEKVLLSSENVAKIIMGQSPPSTSYNSEQIGLPFYQGKKDFGEKYPVPSVWCSKPIKIAKKDDILMSVRAPVGPTNLCIEESCIGRGLAAIRINKLNYSYNFMFFYFKYIKEYITSKGQGSTFQAISKKDLEKLEIPALSIEKQNDIVNKLSKVEKLHLNLITELTEKYNRLKSLKSSLLDIAFKGELVK